MADKGYFKIEDIEACEKAGIVPDVPRPQRGPSVRAGLFRKDEFRYDAASDSYVCPASQRLHPYTSSLLRGLKKVNYVNKLACDSAKSICSAQVASFARFRVLRTKPFWTGWPSGSPGILVFSIGVVRRLSTRLARSNNGEPRGVSDAWPGEGSRRVQPDRARLQSPPGVDIVGFAELMAAVAA